MDLREIGLSLRHGWGAVVVGVLVGLALGIAAIVLLPERYESSAKVLVRGSPDLTNSALAQLGGIGEILGSGVGGGMSSTLDTELEILASRTVVGEVVDALLLQAEIQDPQALPASSVFSAVSVDPRAGTIRYEFVRRDGFYEVTGPTGSWQAVPGRPAALPGAEIVLRPGDLPDRFEVDLMDRDDAIETVQDRLVTESVTNDVAEIKFSSADPQTAAAVPNLLVEKYLERRETTDRGTNSERYEFLVSHTDSITRELAMAEAALRQYQEVSGVVDPRFTGEAQVVRAMELQGEIEAIEVEARALRRILEADQAGSIPTRELAAFPTFLRNAAINDVLARLLELETSRLQLLQTRTEIDPDVIALTSGIEHLEGQLRSLTTAYLGGLAQQRAEVSAELATYRDVMEQLPAQAEESFRRQREVERLSAVQLALNSQLVQSRLAAMGEGGEVRQIDPAVVPKDPVFPSNGFVLLTGLFGGLFFGTIGAVSAGLLRQRVREPWEAELATGVRAIHYASKGPVALPEIRTARTLLLLPVGPVANARLVGEKLVDTAMMQGREAVLADLTVDDQELPAAKEPVASMVRETRSDQSSVVLDLPSGTVSLPVYHANGSEQASQHRALLAHLEEQFPLVVGVVSGIEAGATLYLINPERLVVLVASSSGVTRVALGEAVQTVERFGGRVAAVILVPHDNVSRTAR